jgi:hypothetical protein
MASRRPRKNQRKEERAARERGFESIRRALEPFALGGGGQSDAPDAAGTLSEVIEAFAAPYRATVPADGDPGKLYAVAVRAWNAALREPGERAEALDAALSDLLPGAPDEDRGALREFMDQLVARKDALFADDRRAVASFRVLRRGGRHALAVEASPPGRA